MREIKFRGKRITGEWIYGSLIVYGKRMFIYPENGSQEDYHFYGYEIIPETIGQYAGLKDKNGKEIYIGDIISHNGNRYVMWITENYGVVAISENTFIKEDRTLRMKHRYREFNWIQNVKKYIEVVDSI